MPASKLGFRNVGHSPRIVAQRKTVHVRKDPKASAGGQDVAWRKGPHPALVVQKQTPSSREMNGFRACPLDDGHQDGSRGLTVAKRLPGPRVSVVRWTCRLFRVPFPLVSPGFDVTTASRSIEPPDDRQPIRRGAPGYTDEQRRAATVRQPWSRLRTVG
jgi:hypothetical protein